MKERLAIIVMCFELMFIFVTALAMYAYAPVLTNFIVGAFVISLGVIVLKNEFLSD